MVQVRILLHVNRGDRVDQVSEVSDVLAVNHVSKMVDRVGIQTAGAVAIRRAVRLHQLLQVQAHGRALILRYAGPLVHHGPPEGAATHAGRAAGAQRAKVRVMPPVEIARLQNLSPFLVRFDLLFDRLLFFLLQVAEIALVAQHAKRGHRIAGGQRRRAQRLMVRARGHMG